MDVAEGQRLEAVIGSLGLDIAHVRDEWVLVSRSLPEDDAPARASFQLGSGRPDESGERYVFASESLRLHLKPRLADRPVVIRPRQTVALLSGQRTTLYLSTPIWLRVEVGDPPVLLKEVPVLRMSDTWFGPNTREGELCYAGRTHARHSLEELPERAHRAITPLTIHNRAGSPLMLEKISLPVPLLALYGDALGRLWTQALTLVRESDSDLASVRIEGQPELGSGDLTRLAEPRQVGGRSAVTRAFGLLFGG